MSRCRVREDLIEPIEERATFAKALGSGLVGVDAKDLLLLVRRARRLMQERSFQNIAMRAWQQEVKRLREENAQLAAEIVR